MKKFDIDKLNSISILEVVDMIGLDLHSSNGYNCFKGHDEKSASLKVFENTNSYYCFGCGMGGRASHAINLVMDYYEIPFKEACEVLNNKFYGNSSYLLPTTRIFVKEKTNNFLPDIEIYQWILNNSQLSEKGVNYLQSRGYTLETIKKYKIFDIDNIYMFFKNLRGRWGDERLYKCGLLSFKEDRYRSAWWQYTIVFPYFDLNKNIIYLQGRYLNNTKWRWVNLPNLKSSLYNMSVLNECNKGDDIYICEGITDAISMYQAKKKAVAVMGAHNFKREYIFKLMDYNIWVVPDNDNGGEDFFVKVKKSFEGYKTVKRITFDKKYNDISEYLQDINYGK